MDRVQLLIEIFLDKEADIAEREDALMDIRDYTDSIIEDALLTLIKDVNEDFYLRSDAAETLATFWLDMGKYNLEKFNEIPLIYQKDILFFFGNDKPEWVAELRAHE